jgi:hypothetical protein
MKLQNAVLLWYFAVSYGEPSDGCDSHNSAQQHQQGHNPGMDQP